ncbi:phosphotransferase family protein [Rugosimonospora acidiphila]|uniref:phosphotransferase family protein n=1 Tax=Rugosimonospora acidiphila TaxID=556531 RepID=UPI0031ECBA11
MELTDGFRVNGLEPATGGQKNWVFFGCEEHTGDRVVVKVEGTPGGLADEHRALRWAGRHAVAVPGVRRHGVIRSGSHRDRTCLVLDRLPGRRPQSPADWWRMGVALSGLSRLPWADSGVPVSDAGAAVATHESLAAMLTSQLPEAQAGVLAAAVRAAPAPDTLSRPVFTHGDPGPGNFLVNDDGCDYLLDWETAQVTSMGLDPARAAFLALLAADPDASDTAAGNAIAVWRGYVDGCGWRPGPELTRWWMTVAGLQFVAFRWLGRDTARVLPWQHAVATVSRMGTVIRQLSS